MFYPLGSIVRMPEIQVRSYVKRAYDYVILSCLLSYCNICLFGVYRPTRECFTHMKMSPLPVKGCKFDLCSTLMSIEQWGFLNVPHPLRNGPTVYNGHLRGPVILTPNAERLTVELSLPVFTIEPRSPACKTDAIPLCHRGGLLKYISIQLAKILMKWPSESLYSLPSIAKGTSNYIFQPGKGT